MEIGSAGTPKGREPGVTERRAHFRQGPEGPYLVSRVGGLFQQHCPLRGCRQTFLSAANTEKSRM